IHCDLDLAIDVPRVACVDSLLHSRLLIEQLRHLVVRHRLGELGRYVLELLEEIPSWLDGEVDVFPDVLGCIELGLLRQKSDTRAFVRPRFALKIVIDSCHDLEQRRLASPVSTEDSDLGAGIKREPDAAQNLPRWRDNLAQVFHYINELWRHANNLSSHATPTDYCGPLVSPQCAVSSPIRS